MDESRNRCCTSLLPPSPRVRRNPSDRTPSIASDSTAAACIATCSCDIDRLPDFVLLHIIHLVISRRSSSNSEAVDGATTAIGASSSTDASSTDAASTNDATAPFPYSTDSRPNAMTITTRNRRGYKQQQHLPCKDPTCTCKVKNSAVPPTPPLLTCALVSRRWLRLSALVPCALTVPPGLRLRTRSLLRTLSAFPHLRSLTLHGDCCRSSSRTTRSSVGFTSSSRGTISDWLIARLAALHPQLTSLSLVGVAAIPRLAPLAPSLLCLEIRGAGEGLTHLPGKCLGRLTCLQELALRDCLALRQLPASLALLPSLQRIRVEGCYLLMLDAWTTSRDGCGLAVPFMREDGERAVRERRRNGGIKRDNGDDDVVVSVLSGVPSDGEVVHAYDGRQLPAQWRRRQRRQRKRLHQPEAVCHCEQGGVATLTAAAAAAAQPRQPLFFSNLQHLELADVSALHHLPRGILQHHSLKQLVLDGFSGASLSATGSVDSIESPIRMPSLHHLVLRNLPKLSQLPDCLSLPTACPSLTILSIENCPLISSLHTPPPSLHTLKLHKLPNLTSICDPLRAHCPSLSVLVIERCVGLHNASCFPSLSLSHVEIRNLPNLTALTSPSSLLNPPSSYFSSSSSSPRLSVLAIENCPLLAINPSASTRFAFEFPGLRELWLQDLPLLHELPPSFSCLSSLHRLVIARCHGLNSLPACLPELPLLLDLALVINHDLTVPRDFLPRLHSVRRLVLHRGWLNKTRVVQGRVGVRPKCRLPPRVRELHTDDFGSEVLCLHELETLEVTGVNLAKMSISEVKVVEEMLKPGGEGGRRDAEEEEGNSGFDVRCWEGGRRLPWVDSVLESSQSMGEDSSSEITGNGKQGTDEDSRSRSGARKHGSKYILPCLRRMSLVDCVAGPRFPPWMRHLTSLQHLSLTHIRRCTQLYCHAEQFNAPHQLRRLREAYLQEEEHWENLTSLLRVDRCACCPVAVPLEWQPLLHVVEAVAAESVAFGGDVIRRAGFVLGDLA